MGAVKSTNPKPVTSKNPFLKKPAKLISDELTNSVRENYHDAMASRNKTKKRSKKG